jgi:hypothetical protein
VSGRNYSQATKLGALELVRQHGVRGAARKSGISRNTLSRWAREDCVDTSGIEIAAQNRRAAAVANTGTVRRSAEAREASVGRLQEIVELAQTRTAELLEDGDFTTGKDLQALTDCFESACKLVELLEGRATARTAVIDETARQEIIDHVVESIRRALELAGLTPDAAMLVRVAFSYAVRGELDDEAIRNTLRTERWKLSHPSAYPAWPVEPVGELAAAPSVAGLPFDEEVLA